MRVCQARSVGDEFPVRSVVDAPRPQYQRQEPDGCDDACGGQGSRVVIETDGPDKTEALDAIAALIGSGFRETD